MLSRQEPVPSMLIWMYVTPDQQKHEERTEPVGDPAPPGASESKQMRHKLQTAEGQPVYQRGKAIVEPVFGQIKKGRRYRRFSFRGKAKVTSEWLLICLTHNLLKLFRAGVCPQAV